ncbi:hypothetical protein [Dactylosporangium sp. NPDC051541]|uniref:hypothetical protein n=1 Tax=Dactylosporangium sp. NPDC051541 TaxID=3363977 RepID=UPI003789C0B2
MPDRRTTDAQAALDQATGPTPRDLAQALATHRGGNTAGLWTTPPPATPTPPAPVQFDADTEAVLARAAALHADHVGTEHLLAALVHSTHPDVVTWLAEQGATAEAVDQLLANLNGGLGVESLPGEPLVSGAPAGKKPRSLSPAWTIAITVVVVIVVFVLCVWGP